MSRFECWRQRGRVFQIERRPFLAPFQGTHVMPKVTYPFLPRSTKAMLLGQFWAIPLSDGRFACGRVVELRVRDDGTRDSRGFLAGLLDWVGSSNPTSDSIAG